MRSSQSYQENVKELMDHEDVSESEAMIEAIWNELADQKRYLQHLSKSVKDHGRYHEYQHTIEVIEYDEENLKIITEYEYEDYQRLLSAELAAKREEQEEV